jgi:formylglycine-generating enzyme required for sulfatase activity
VSCVRLASLSIVAATWSSTALWAQEPHREQEPESANEGESSEGQDTAEAPAAPRTHPKSLPKPLRGHRVEKDGMMLIAEGAFFMGPSTPRAHPRGPLKVSAFWLDRTEVTVGAYRACVSRGQCTAPHKTSAKCSYDSNDLNLPINCIRWADAERFCRHDGKRLATEIEWEFAARGTQGLTYPWGVAGRGQGICKVAATLAVERNWGKSCTNGPVRVGSYPKGASPFGVLDMAGNVEEWVSDWYVERPGPTPPSSGNGYVLRGGSWASPPSMARGTARTWASALEAGPTVGFRCAKNDLSLTF